MATSIPNATGRGNAPQWAQEAQMTPTCSPGHQEWAPNSKIVAKLREAVTEHKSPWVCLPLPWFEPLPPLEDIPLIEVPNLDESQSLLMPVCTMSMVMYKNEIKGNLKYGYETKFLDHLHSEVSDHGPKITELWVIKWVICQNFV